MKLVLEISDDDYEIYKKYDHVPFSVLEAFRNAKPLPKGHGRLIDADVLADGFEDNYEFCEVVNATPTIIEADRSKEE